MLKLNVQLRGGFSDRVGLKPVNVEMQIYDFDDRTRSGLITATRLAYSQYKKIVYDSKTRSDFLADILANVYAQEVNYEIWYDEDKIIDIVCNTIRNDDYDDVLTIIEYLTMRFDEMDYYKRAIKRYNFVFEREFVGYRIVDKVILPITDSNEVEEIQEAISTPHKEVNNHLSKSLRFLSDRKTPDYSNSIKESICAVERMCSLIIGKSTTLGEALGKLEKSGLRIHPAMKNAFEKLYGYTSDGSGIRHSGQLGGADSTFEEAKFMLVSCCAFVNYLIGVCSKYSD